MKDNYRLGVLLSIVGVLVGLAAFVLFIQIYNPMIQIELDAGRPDEAVVVRYVFPLLGYLATSAGVLWAVALYGFLLKESWAWLLGVIASTIHLLAGFFPMIPAMSRGAPPMMGAVFFPSLALWIGLLFVRRVPWKIAALAFAAGLAYVLSFMDGVATIDKIQLSVGQSLLNGMYVMVQEVNWWATIAWAVFIFALLGRKTWAQPVGLFAGLMAALGGYPLAVVNTLEVGRFSMFLPSPVLSTLLVVVLALPGTRKLLGDWVAGKAGETRLKSAALPQAAGATD
ncbi:MAG: hypothetical protein PHS96_01510 [Anaerolineales bacterium]|nr:hypothetical protein [Anaerolineales bacterium]